MLARTAWRNLWRNPRRTTLTVAAFSLGVMAIVTMHSFAENTYDLMIDTATRGIVGHLQVHGKGYQDEPRLETAVREPGAVHEVVERVLRSTQVVDRVAGAGLAAVGEKSAAAMILGVEAAREQQVTGLYRIVKGRDLGGAASREALLGSALAKKLKADVGAELVMVSQAADGSLANDRFAVVGLANGLNTELTDATVFLHLRDAQEFFALGTGVHQVLVNLESRDDPKKAAAALRAALGATALEALAWNEMLPEVEQAVAADRMGTFAVDFIVFLIVMLGIFNTMTMSTFERTVEFGVLMSLGTRRSGVLGLVVAEAAFLGAVSMMIGTALGVVLLSSLGEFDLSGYGSADFMGVQVPQRVHLGLNASAAVYALVTASVTTLVGSLLPAWRASRLRPAEAVRVV